MELTFEFNLIDNEKGINDSKDESGKICLQFAEKDLRINYYYQDNSGAAAERNNAQVA